MEFRRTGSLWLPDRPRFVAGGRRQSMLMVNNLIGFGGGGGVAPPVLTVVATRSQNANSNTIATMSGISIGAGNLIIVVVTTPSNVTLSSVSDGTNTYTVDDAGTGSPCVAIASCANCSAISSGTITATLSGTVISQKDIAVYSVANAALSTPLDKKASASGTSTSPSATTAATTVNNTVVVGALGTTGGSTFTDDSNFTNDQTQNTGGRLAESHKTTNPTATGAQTYAPSLGSSVAWRCLVAAYKGLS